MDPGDGTVPLDETYTETVEYYGRTYQQYALTYGTYFAPIDEEEIARLAAMHAVLCKVFDNRLIFPPVARPGTILECGYGAADWAVDVAEQYPNTTVLGIDISPHMIPEDMPENLDLQVDDLNGDFTFPSDYFDIVHSQMMAGGIHRNRWRSYLRDIYRVLQPGGWCQMVEIYFNAQSDNGTLSKDHALSRWSSGYLEAMHPQKDPRAPLRLAEWMRSAGFTEIESRVLTLPMCPWSGEPRDHDIGAANRENVSKLLYSLGLYPFTHMKQMPLEDFQLLVAQARREANDPAFKAYFPLTETSSVSARAERQMLCRELVGVQEANNIHITSNIEARWRGVMTDIKRHKESNGYFQDLRQQVGCVAVALTQLMMGRPN